MGKAYESAYHTGRIVLHLVLEAMLVCALVFMLKEQAPFKAFIWLSICFVVITASLIFHIVKLIQAKRGA